MKPCFSLLLGLLVALLCGCATHLNHAAGLPDLLLGQQGLAQQVTQQQLADGLTHYQITRGKPTRDFYTLSSGIVNLQKLASYRQSLQQLGVPFRLETPAETGPSGHALGKMVRVGQFTHEEEAVKKQQQLAAAGLKLALRYSAEDGTKTTGPFQISLLEIDLERFQGQLIAALAQGHIQGTATTSAIAQSHGAIAAVNGGFFVWKSPLGTVGDLAGLSVIEGKLVSEAVNQRPALLMTDDNATILHNVVTRISLQLGEKRYPIQGVNRVAGKTLNCGNDSDPLLSRAAHDHLCQNHNEAIVYNHYFGPEVSLADGVVLIVQKGKVVEAIPLTKNSRIATAQDKQVIYLSSGWLQQHQLHYQIGQAVQLVSEISSAAGPLALSKDSYMLNGGPTLIRNAKLVSANRANEGWDTHYSEIAQAKDYSDKQDQLAVQQLDGDRRGFYYAWVVRRHPRSAVGITADNRLYIAVVYGRQPGISAGASISEMALMLQQLGAIEAMNLDGGGSTMMVVNGQAQGRPSDPSGERAVADALLILKP